MPRQEQLLRSDKAELEKRDVTQIVLRRRAKNAEIAEQFKFANVGFTLVLIGEKLRSREFVDPETLCRPIDPC
jgi:hypothetical protein